MPILEEAERLAEVNVEAEPNIEAIYLFPSDTEIRLVELDPTALPGEDVTPYYFNPEPASNIHHPFAIALILPQEFRVALPPAEWGNWDAAVKIWPRK